MTFLPTPPSFPRQLARQDIRILLYPDSSKPMGSLLTVFGGSAVVCYWQNGFFPGVRGRPIWSSRGIHANAGVMAGGNTSFAGSGGCREGIRGRPNSLMNQTVFCEGIRGRILSVLVRQYSIFSQARGCRSRVSAYYSVFIVRDKDSDRRNFEFAERRH